MNTLTNMLARLKRSIAGTSFAKHVMVVSGSVIIGQIISVLVGPINSRLYKPSDYGTLSVFGAMFSVLGVVGTLQYEMALGTVEDDDEAAHLLVLCLLITAIWTGLIVGITFTAGNWVTHWLSKDDKQLLRYLWFLPIGVCFYSLSQTFSRWAMRKHAFPQLSLVQIMNNVIGSACTVTLGFFSVGLPGLITGSIMASVYSLWKLTRLTLPDFTAKVQHISFPKLIKVAKSQYRYPLYTTWSVLLNSLSVYIPIFLLTKGFGSSYTGYFSLCQRILYLPTLLISGAITPVFYSRAKQAQKDGTLAALTTKLINSISGINVFFPVFIGLFGEWLFVLVFGGQWRRAGQYAATQAPWMFFSFLVYPLEALPLIYNKQRIAFLFQIVQFILRMGSLMIGISFHNDMLAMWLFGSTSALYMLIYFIWLFRLVNGPVAEILRKLGKDLVLAVVVFGACRGVMWWSSNNPYVMIPLLVPVLGYFSFRGIRQMLLGRSQSLDKRV